MEAEKVATQEIEILDAQGSVVATITTDQPEWSFEEFTRNRSAAGWTCREKVQS